MSRTAILALVLMAACGGGSEDKTPVDVDAGVSDADVDRATPLPPGVDHMEGLVACCAEGAGHCCEAGGPCVTWSACSGVGEPWSAKLGPCRHCCAGLGTFEAMEVNADGSCAPDHSIDVPYVCGLCGDGRCDAPNGENRCSCPADCP